MKKIITLSVTTILASCSFQQQPAPYEAYGSKFYGKGNPNTGSVASNDYVQPPKKGGVYSNSSETSSASLTGDDYNRRIDEQNSKTISSRPLSSATTTPPPMPSSETRTGLISTRQLMPAAAIDGDQQVVSLQNKPTISPTIRTGSSVNRFQPLTTQSEAPKEVEVVTAEKEETVPPANSKEGFLNISKVTQQNRDADNKLANLTPRAKPEYKGDVEAEAKKETAEVSEKDGKIKITPKIQKIETAAGTIGKSTSKMIAETDTHEVADEQEDIKPIGTDKTESIALPAAKPVAEPIKPVEKAAEVEAPKAAEKAAEAETVKPAEKAKVAKVVEPRETLKEAAKPEVKPEAKPVAKTETAKVEAAKPSAVEAEKPAAKEEEAEEEKKITDIKQADPKGAPQFIKPVDGVVISEFGSDKASGGFNDGISIQAAEGTPVKAASGGTVVYSGNQLQGYGNLIIVRHSNGYLSAYSHLKELELKKGDKIEQGGTLGHVGKTGNVDTPQLHFGIRKGREPVDPKDYL